MNSNLSPRNKLIIVSAIVILIAILTELTSLLKIPDIAELQISFLKMLPAPVLQNIPFFFKNYLFLTIILLVIIIFFSLRRKPNRQKVIKDEIGKQRTKVKNILDRTIHRKKIKKEGEWVKIGVPGFDDLFEKGIPRGSSVLVAGGPGSGKTIFCLQTLNNVAKKGEKALYISLEESEERLKRHMHDFNFDPEKLEKKGLLRIKRVDPFYISKNVEALLAKAKGELKIDIAEIGELIPADFSPEWIFIDSLTALEAAFKSSEESYRIYIEQLFKYFESLSVTSFLITETEQIPIKYSSEGVEEFLADCVVVFYNIRRGDIRENAIEVLKLRGGKHEKKIVAMRIESGKGIVVYPEQEVFGGIEEEHEK